MNGSQETGWNVLVFVVRGHKGSILSYVGCIQEKPLTAASRFFSRGAESGMNELGNGRHRGDVAYQRVVVMAATQKNGRVVLWGWL